MKIEILVLVAVLAFVSINQTGNWTEDSYSCASDRPYQSDLVDRSWCGNWTEDGCPTGYQRDLLSRAWCAMLPN